MALLVDERAALLLRATIGAAQQHLLFDRDATDSYRLQLVSLHEGQRQLSRAEVMPALPAGSRWAGAVGWESYVVFPALAPDTPDGAALIGLEYVEPHPTRGAYPIFAGVVLPLAAVPGALAEIAAGLDPDAVAPVAPSYGVRFSTAQSPQEYRRDAAWLLRAASASFAAGEHALKLRTAVLTEDEVPGAWALLLPRSLLLGVAPPLLADFSWKARKRLELSMIMPPLEG